MSQSVKLNAARCVRAYITIPADLQSTWTALVDFAHMHLWFAGVKRVKLHGTPGAGTVRTVSFVASIRFHETIVIWAPPRHFVLEAKEASILVHSGTRISVALEPAATGTRISWQIDYRPRFRLLGQTLSAIIGAPLVRHALMHSLRRLRQILARR